MLQEEGVDVKELEQKLAEADEGDATVQQGVDSPEDYWSPVSDPIRAGNVDEYGSIQPVPQHDGTECLKWDDSLRSHADHFKVCCLHLAFCVVSMSEASFSCSAACSLPTSGRSSFHEHAHPCNCQSTMLMCLQYRWNVYKGIRQAIEDNEGGIDTFSQGRALAAP